jgi:hypothetical protein
MFEESKEPVTDVTENVEEQTTEKVVEDGEDESVESKNEENTEEVVEEPQEQEKRYTEEEMNQRVDEILAKKIARKEAKIRREYEKKYGRAETILKAGLQKDNFDEAVDELESFYKQEGVSIPSYQYSDRDTEILANAEANEIIDSGYDDMVEEVDRLASIGVENMSKRDKIIFQRLAEERKKVEEEKEMKSLGIGKNTDTTDFKEFSKKLNPELSMKDKYEMYLKFKPKPEVEPIGSMKNTKEKDSGVKEFYTRDEALKFTKSDFDKNPALYKAIEKSMLKW